MAFHVVACEVGEDGGFVDNLADDVRVGFQPEPNCYMCVCSVEARQEAGTVGVDRVGVVGVRMELA